MATTANVKIIRSFRKSMVVSVLSDTTVVVKAPLFTPTFVINTFIKQHQDWIQKRTEKMQKRQKVQDKQFANGEKILFLGKEYTLQIGSYRAITTQENYLLFPQVFLFRAKKELTEWYIRKAREIITQQVETYAKQMDVSYKNIMFSDTISKWGSCTHDNRLQFNWRLVMSPLLVLNYVVVHELAHTLEKNHSVSFWSKVRLYNPSYRQQRKWLKDHGNLLVV